MTLRRLKITLAVGFIFLAILIIVTQTIVNELQSVEAKSQIVMLEPMPAGEGLLDTATGQAVAFAIESFAPAPEDVPSCIVWLEPIGSGDELKFECQPIGNEVDTAVWLEEMIQQSPESVLLGILYSGSSGTGSQLWFTTSNPNGCLDGSGYQSPDLSVFGWANIASSMGNNSGAGCNYGAVYDAVWFGQPLYVCGSSLCGSLGAMNNAPESWKGWR